MPGTEADHDLLLLCRACHEAVHASIDASVHWRRMDRRSATWSILRVLTERAADPSDSRERHPSFVPTTAGETRTITRKELTMPRIPVDFEALLAAQEEDIADLQSRVAALEEAVATLRAGH